MDTSKAGQLIAEQMAALERDFGEKEGYQVVGGVSIVLIQGPEGLGFRTRSNLGNAMMTLGALRMAEDNFLLALREGNIAEGPGGDDQDPE